MEDKMAYCCFEQATMDAIIFLCNSNSKCREG
jgi:hypothetical protein